MNESLSTINIDELSNAVSSTVLAQPSQQIVTSVTPSTAVSSSISTQMRSDSVQTTHTPNTTSSIQVPVSITPQNLSGSYVFPISLSDPRSVINLPTDRSFQVSSDARNFQSIDPNTFRQSCIGNITLPLSNERNSGIPLPGPVHIDTSQQPVLVNALQSQSQTSLPIAIAPTSLPVAVTAASLMPITTIASERQQQQQPNSQQPISINVNINMGGGGNNMLVPSNRQIGKDTSVSSPNDVTTIHCITTNSNQADAVTMVPINKQADMENILTETLVTELWCVDCECSHCGDCPQHGPLNLIEDTPIESKARMSLPKLLRFQKSMISNHSVGVWTYESLGSRCQFGPLNGKIIKKNDETIPQEVLNSPMVWEIFIDGKSSHYIDGRDESESNWMIFVKRARRQSEQNLVAYQYGNSIYFTTKHSIEPGKELLLWYNREYAKLIGVTEKPEESYKCSKCEKQFADLSQLGRHMKYSHPDMSCRKWKCHMCDRAFTSSAKLNVHVLVHMGVKPHKCEHCDKTFTDPSNLRMHVSIHTGLKKFQCDICGNSFRQKAHLLSHKITHTGEKKLKCQYCDKMFSRHSDVKQHTYMHTKEKEVPCQECGKTFWRLQHLKKHMKVHSGERNYKCEKCQKGFVTKYHLKRHSEACKGPKENKSTTTKTTKNSSTVRMAADSSNEPSKTIDRPRRTRRLRRRNNYDDDEEEQPEDFQRRAHVPQQAAHQTHQPEILQIPQHSSSLLSHQASNVSLGPSTYQTSGMHQPNMLLQSHHLQHPIITVPVTSSIPIIQNLPLTHTIPNTAHNITILPNMPLNLPSMTAAQHNLPTITSHSILPIPSTSHSLPTMQTTSHNMQTMSDEVITNEVCEASSNQEQDAVTSSIEE